LAIAAGLISGTVLVSGPTAGQHGTAADNTSLAATSSSEGAGQAAPDNIRMDASSNIRMGANIRMD
jgi:hypothetical protein